MSLELLTDFVVSHHAYLDGKTIVGLIQLRGEPTPDRAQLTAVRNAVLSEPTPTNIETYRQTHRQIFIKKLLSEIIRCRAGQIVLRTLRRFSITRRQKRYTHICNSTDLPICLVGEIAKYF